MFFSLLLFLKGLHLLPSEQCKQLPTSIFNISQFPIPNFSKKEPKIPSLVPVLLSIIEAIIFIFIFICLEVHSLDYRFLRSRNLVLIIKFTAYRLKAKTYYQFSSYVNYFLKISDLLHNHYPIICPLLAFYCLANFSKAYIHIQQHHS